MKSITVFECDCCNSIFRRSQDCEVHEAEELVRSETRKFNQFVEAMVNVLWGEPASDYIVGDFKGRTIVLVDKGAKITRSKCKLICMSENVTGGREVDKIKEIKLAYC